MNQKQRIVLLVAAVVVALMLLFPPFHYERPLSLGRMNLGYAFLLTPATISSGDAGSVSIGTLLTQWSGVVVVSALLVYMLKD